MDYIAAIDRFIESRTYHYALMISGSWGSGKTYFVKNVLLPHLEGETELGRQCCETSQDEKNKKWKVDYFSLYGIKTSDEISRMVTVQVIKDSIEEKRGESKNKDNPLKSNKGGVLITKVASTAINALMNSFGVAEGDVNDIIDVFQNYDNHIMIFDDLERCMCPIDEVLGFINSYVEHSGARVIIVANEEEIGQGRLLENRELQTLVALDPRLDVQHPEEDSIFWEDVVRGGKKPEENKALLDPEEITYRRQVLFGENEEYKRIKEKVIGVTINYEPDLRSLYSHLIEHLPSISDSFKEALQFHVDWFVDTAIRTEHTNIRTFQYFLELVDAILRTVGVRDRNVIDIIIRYAYRISIIYKSGGKMPKWEAEFGEQIFGKVSFFVYDSLPGFKFIDDAIVTNQIDQERVCAVLDDFERKQKTEGILDDDPTNKIESWWRSEDEEVIIWLDEIRKNILEDKYSIETYSKILRYISNIKSYHIMEEQCDSVYQAMEQQVVSSGKSELIDSERTALALEGQAAAICHDMCSNLNRIISEHIKNDEKERFVEAIMDEERWANNIWEASRVDNRPIEGHSFVFWLEPGDLVERIKTSSNNELIMFRTCMQALYGDRSHYANAHDDYENLKAILTGVSEIDSAGMGQIKKAYLKWISDDIERYLEKTKPKKVESGDSELDIDFSS